MNELTQVYAFTCPCCWEINENIADLSAGQQHYSYIEDCRVCCHPVQISFSVVDNQIVDLHTEQAM